MKKKRSAVVILAMGCALMMACNDTLVAPDSTEGQAHFESSSSSPSSLAIMDGSSSSVKQSSSSSQEIEPSSSSVSEFSSSSGAGLTSSAQVSSSGMVFVDNRTTPATEYPIVKIGAQYWMAKNMAYFVATETDSVDVARYGRLYTWAAAKLVCPSGWHLPTDADWQQLELQIGMPVADVTVMGTGRGTTEGNQLKANNGLWTTNRGTDAWGFAALPGGDGLEAGSYVNGLTVVGWGNSANFWTATAGTASATAITRGMSGNDNHLFRWEYSVNQKHSVRCLQD